MDRNQELKVEDFASATIGTDGTPIKDSKIYTKEKLSDDEYYRYFIRQSKTLEQRSNYKLK